MFTETSSRWIFRLEVGDDLEEIAGLKVATWT